jgi:alkanesulfonate monooxygenase SsuD/methylene tetrahydromethanopterin reductase-like flavin-dependent oxidoreductase (luciferase family)
MKDAVLAMKELWTKDEAEYHGRYYNFPPVWSWPKPVQKPHPPIFLGGRAAGVFQRIVEWGDGWMPNRITPEELRRGRATLNELAAKAGRDPRSIQITAFGGADRIRDPKALPELAQAGADRVVLYLGEAAGEAGVKFVALVGGREWEMGKVKCRDMGTGEEREVTVEELPAK